MKHLFIKSGLMIVTGDLLGLPHYNPTDLKVSASDYVVAEALVQHYGYQTRYVDVTSSLDVAVWFATHRFEGRPDAPCGAEPPFQLTFPAWYVRASDPGLIYVLDVEPWNAVSSIAAGEYIDLIPIAPGGVNRPRRQLGGLLHAPAWGSQAGDVHSLVRAKFEIRFPWEDVGKVWDTDYVFPGPAEDPIYGSLLHAPFFRTFRPLSNGGEENVLRRSCTLPEYWRRPEDSERAALYRTYDYVLKPTLYYPWLRRNLDALKANPEWHQLRAGFERSTPIMLQRPSMLFSMHRGGPPPWPEEAPDEVPPLFRNFFLEFPPDSFALAYDEQRMSRGFWCFWLNAQSFLLQSFGTRGNVPSGTEVWVFEWRKGRGLVQTMGPELPRDLSFVSFPLSLIRMTVDGLLRVDPPGNLGHGYFEMTTTEKFWPALPSWTDLM